MVGLIRLHRGLKPSPLLEKRGFEIEMLNVPGLTSPSKKFGLLKIMSNGLIVVSLTVLLRLVIVMAVGFF